MGVAVREDGAAARRVRGVMLLLFVGAAAAAGSLGEGAASGTPVEVPGSVYDRWAGRSQDELVAWLGTPSRVERSADRGRVLVYELRITCAGSVEGVTFLSIAPDIVVGSQDLLDRPGDPAALTPALPRRSGKRVAAEQTIRFYVDGSGRIDRHESGAARTHWKRCGY